VIKELSVAGRTVTVVLGGGRGTRLFPLTAVRAKPAVPLAGKYRLIDIPISNAINSGLREIYVLTQFNSASLNAHVTKTYRFDAFSHGTVEILAAEQTETSQDWYQGTADAVRQHLHHFLRDGVENVIVLSGDHLYRMDYRQLLERHETAGADITISTISVPRSECGGFGVVGVDDAGWVGSFCEKPPDTKDLSHLEVPKPLRDAWSMGDSPFLASMGVYAFRAEVLEQVLADFELIDFGHHILPRAVKAKRRVAAFHFDDYWEDIGTVRSFYDANLALCGDTPPFRFFDAHAPIYTRARFLPPSLIRNVQVEHGFIADGCMLFGSRIENSVIGLRSRMAPGSEVVDSIIMGADYYETAERRAAVRAAGGVPVGIGRNASVRRAIIDKCARIGDGARVHGHPDRPDEDHAAWVVRDGIVIVRKNATIPPGTVL
jgi:glucose-1-phosphate adenylyltransferase